MHDLNEAMITFQLPGYSDWFRHGYLSKASRGYLVFQDFFWECWVEALFIRLLDVQEVVGSLES